MEIAKYKKCTKCNVEKEDTEFYWRKKGIRRRTQCKKCCLVVAKKYFGTAKGKAVAKKAQKKHSKTAKGKATKKKYRGTEAGVATDKKYAGTTKGRATRKKADKKHNGTAKGRATRARANAKRRSKIEGIINDLTKEQWSQILKDQAHKCNGCKDSFSEEKPAEKDHIIPVDKDGGLTKENIQALCKSCNSIKGNRTMQFLIENIEREVI